MKSFQEFYNCWGFAPGNKRKATLFLTFCICWAIVFVAASWVLKHQLVPSPYNWMLVLLPTIMGIACLVSYYQLLKHSDELYRKIQLEGLAVGFGTGLVFGTGYGLLARLGFPAMDLTTLVAIMCFGWIAGQVMAAANYQ